jgi:hypothetical protein
MLELFVFLLKQNQLNFLQWILDMRLEILSTQVSPESSELSEFYSLRSRQDHAFALYKTDWNLACLAA